MKKVKCIKCGQNDAEILRRGKYSKDVLFCPYCDDICNALQID